MQIFIYCKYADIYSLQIAVYVPLLTATLNFTALTTAYKLCKRLLDWCNVNMTFLHLAEKQTTLLALGLRTHTFSNSTPLKFSYCSQSADLNFPAP